MSKNKLELLSKQAVADRLQLSVRRVMEFAGNGTFTRHRAFDPETRREAVMFDAAEVEAYNGRRSYDQVAAPAAARIVKELPAPAAIEPASEAPRPLRQWLTLAEAAEYSGLPASILHAMIAAGELKAINVGPRPGGRYRVRKLDVDAIEGV